MKKSSKFSSEVHERAVRMVQEKRREYPLLWSKIELNALKIGCLAQILHDWVKQAEVVSGARPRVSTAEAHRVKDLDVAKEVCRADESPKLASVLFVQAGLGLALADSGARLLLQMPRMGFASGAPGCAIPHSPTCGTLDESRSVSCGIAFVRPVR